MDIIEIYETFVSIVLAWQKEIGGDMQRVNPNGGAIAHGHPLGATGANPMTKLVHAFHEQVLRFGLETKCIGNGMATATIIEVADI